MWNERNALMKENAQTDFLRGMIILIEISYYQSGVVMNNRKVYIIF